MARSVWLHHKFPSKELFKTKKGWDTVGLVVCHALYILKQGFGSLLSFKLETGYSLKLS